MIDKQKGFAINVIKESADVYYDKLKEVPEDVRKQLTLDMLREIFEYMVKPAIDKARSLDRNKDDIK